MSKILIVDDDFSAMNYSKVLGYDGGKFLCRSTSDFNERFSKPTKSKDIQGFEKRLAYGAKHPFFDVSSQYHSIGGTTSREIYVLSKPVSIISEHVFWNEHEADEESKLFCASMLKRNFPFDKIIADIKEINPDVLLLDIGITSYVSLEKREELREVFKEHNKIREEIADLAYARQLNHYRFREVPFTTGGLSEDNIDHLLNAKGGAVLGYFLKKEGISFSLWSSPFHHAYDNLQLASNLGILGVQEFSELMADFLDKSINKTENTHGNIPYHVPLYHDIKKTVMVGCKSSLDYHVCEELGKESVSHNNMFGSRLSVVDEVLEGLD